MNTTVKAQSADEVESKFGYDFFIGNTQSELDERVQLGKFLMAASRASLLQYPLEVTPTRDRKPDFQLFLGGKTISAEATKIANKELEWARGLQRRSKLGTMYVTPFLKPATEKRDRAGVLNEGFATPAFVIGNTAEEEDAFWLKQAEDMLRRKTEIFRRPDFERRQENWLLLWDKLRSSDSDLERRVPILSELLREFWGSTWFDKVIVEHEFFECFVILTPNDVSWLPSSPRQ